MPGIGIGISPSLRRGGGVSWSSYCTALTNAMTNKPSTRFKTALNTSIAILTDGGVWNKLDRLWVFGLHTNGAGESLLDFIHPAGTPAALTNGAGGSVPTFTAYQGFTGHVANKSFINTQFNGTLHAVNFTQDAASMGVYTRTNVTSESCITMGNASGYGVNHVSPYYAGFRGGINNGAIEWADHGTRQLTGLASVVRNSATNLNFYRGSTKSADIAVNSGAIVNSLISILSGNGGYYDAGQVFGAFIGGLLTEADMIVMKNFFDTIIGYCELEIYDPLNTVEVIGDSTSAWIHANAVAISSLMSASGYVVHSIAAGGDNIAGQKAKWTAIGEKRKVIDMVFVMIGLNDLTMTTAALVAAYQDLINTIRTDIGATGKIIGATMIPCNRSGDQQWTDLNAAIKGEGATPITGLDAVIDTVATALNNGSDGLAALYDLGDALHENTAGRQIIADLYDAKITELGF